MWVSNPEVPGFRGFLWVFPVYKLASMAKSMWVVCIFNFLRGSKLIYRSNVLFILFQDWGCKKSLHTLGIGHPPISSLGLSRSWWILNGRSKGSQRIGGGGGDTNQVASGQDFFGPNNWGQGKTREDAEIVLVLVLYIYGYKKIPFSIALHMV